MANSEAPANRIPAEELEEIRPWQLPEIDARGNIVASAEKEARERRARQAEVVEDVDAEQLQPITAESLQQITEAAEAEGRERGYREGLEKGAGEGREQALQETRAQMQAAEQRLTRLFEALCEPLQAQDNALEQQLLAMVCHLTRGIVGRELHTDSSHILAIVERALAALPVGAGNITLYLNPDDLALVEAFAEQRRKDWQFVGEPGLLPGGCRLETRESLVDYAVETRMDTLLAQFLDQKLGAEDGAADSDSGEDAGADTEAGL